MLWGVFHGACFYVTVFFLKRNIKILPTVILFIGVVVGRLIFADSETERLATKLQFIYSDTSAINDLLKLNYSTKLSILLVILFASAEILLRNTKLFRQRKYKFYRLPVVQLMLLMLTLGIVSNGGGIDYAIYGQR
jgi:hypothetical protein